MYQQYKCLNNYYEILDSTSWTNVHNIIHQCIQYNNIEYIDAVVSQVDN